MNDLNLKNYLSVKEIAFICKYKLGSKLAETTIKQYIYKSIKNNSINKVIKNRKIYIKTSDFIDFLAINYSKLGFSYNPTIKELPDW